MPRRLAPFAVLALALALQSPAYAADPIMPLSQVRPGLDCIGLSVVRGTTISSFDVEVLDVIAGETGRGPRILARASGPAVDETGIGSGFSGSPVLCREDGGVRRNAGAISEGVGDFGNKDVLVTPIEEILTERPAPTPRSARADPALRAAARPLLGPLTVTGVSRTARRVLSRAARRAGRPLLSAPTGPLGGYPVQELRAGASVAVSFASGDLGLGSVGTITYRDGSTVFAFGHPLDALGERSLFLQDAYVFTVVANPISSPDLGLGSYKLAAGGHTVGKVTNDAPAAVVGEVGSQARAVRLSVRAFDQDRGRRIGIVSELADERALGLGVGLAGVGPLVALEAADRLLRANAPVRLRMCTLFKVRQRRRRFGFCNAYFSLFDAGEHLSEATGLVEDHDLSPLTLQRVGIRLDLRRGAPEEVLIRAQPPRRIRPGQRFRLRVLVQRRRGGRRWLSLRLEAPRSLRPGRRSLLLAGTQGGSLFDDEDGLVALIAPELGGEGAGEEPREPRSLRELIRRIRAFERPLGIHARFRGSRRVRFVHRSDDVSFSGSLRVPLRVARRKRR
jgi:hypothetical protein